MFGRPTPFKTRKVKSKYNVNIPIDVQKAKRYPIENLYSGDLKRTGKVLLGKCPFHKEDTPSFVIYPENSSWFCFGACREGGDVINFYRKLHSCSFKEAVDELSQ